MLDQLGGSVSIGAMASSSSPRVKAFSPMWAQAPWNRLIQRRASTLIEYKEAQRTGVGS